MANSAGQRLRTAVQAELQSKKRAAAMSAEASKGLNQKRKKRIGPASDPLSLLAAAGQSPAVIELTLKGGKLEVCKALPDKDVASNVPLIFHLVKGNADESFIFEGPCNDFRVFFASCDKRNDPGRLRKQAGALTRHPNAITKHSRSKMCCFLANYHRAIGLDYSVSRACASEISHPNFKPNHYCTAHGLQMEEL